MINEAFLDFGGTAVFAEAVESVPERVVAEDVMGVGDDAGMPRFEHFDEADARPRSVDEQKKRMSFGSINVAAVAM